MREVAPSAATPVVVHSAGGDTASIALPTTGTASDVATTAVFDGSAQDSQVGVHPTRDGFRALVRIASADAPERYDFVVGEDAASLRAEDDGSVTVLDAAGEPVAYVESPWARDASGTSIPSHFEVDGLTLTQVVEHRGAGYSYPLVADPFWSDAWEVVKCTAAIGAFVAGNLLLVTKVRKLGGIAKAVNKLRGASNAANRYKAAIALFGEVAGINAVVQECG